MTKNCIKNLLFNNVNEIINYIYSRINFFWIYLILLILYIFVGYSSYGYDDEIFNINLIEKLGWKTINFVQSSDVHPPGSYIVDLALYNIFREWSIVRAVISSYTAISLIYAINFVKYKFGARSAVIFFFLLGLNPAILMWCTGLRWYAFFGPTLIWLSLPRSKNGWFLWMQCFGGLLLLGYFGYAVFLIGPSIFLLYWKFSVDELKNKIKQVSAFSFCFLVLYSNQLFIFFTVHFKNRNSQTSSIANNIIGFLIAQFSNQGIFPFSFPGLVSSIGTAGIFFLLLFSKSQYRHKNYFLSPYLSGVFLLIISGLSGKFRNLVILSPFQALWISTSTLNQSRQKVFNVLVLLIIFGNICGIYNVLTHQDTTKNSWNMPIQEVLDDLKGQQQDCHGDLLVLSHAPNLAWQLRDNNFEEIGPYSQDNFNYKIKNQYECMVLLKTNIGVLPVNQYEAMYRAIDNIKYTDSSIKYYGRDKYFFIKQKLDKSFPEYSIQLTLYRQVSNLEGLKVWSADQVNH